MDGDNQPSRLIRLRLCSPAASAKPWQPLLPPTTGYTLIQPSSSLPQTHKRDARPNRLQRLLSLCPPGRGCEGTLRAG